MRIIIDLQGTQTASRFRGIGRYGLSLAKAIVSNRGDHEVLIALNGLFPETIEPIRAAFDGILPQESIRIWYAPGPIRERQPGDTWRREAAERIREAFIASLEPDVVLVTSLFEGFVDDAVTSIGVFDLRTPTVVTLHDLIPLLNPDHYLRENPAYERCYLRKIYHLKRAYAWLAVSDSSAREAVTALGIPPDRVFTTYEACDERFRPIDIPNDHKAELLSKYKISRPFIMCAPGGTDPRKNLDRLIRTFAFLPDDLRRAHQLVIVSNISYADKKKLDDIARDAHLEKDELVITGYVTDEDLLKLYNLCRLFIYPSWHEGFGLPPLEAMACGAPVIAANASSLPEVIGRDDALFDPHSNDAIAAKIKEVLTDNAFRSELIHHGLVQAKKFSWDESAKRAIAAIERICRSVARTRANESISRKLIESIAAMKHATFSDNDLIATAWAISLNHPESRSRQLFVDVSELAQRDAGSGIQRVTKSILKELLNNPPQGYQVKPVYATTDMHGYRHARNFTQRFRGGSSGSLEDDPIDAQLGDIFLGLDLQWHVVIAQLDYLESLRNRGIRVIHLVHDLLPILLTHDFPKGMAEIHARWLDAISRFDGTLCVSRAVADEYAKWLRTNGIQRLRPLKIGWFHLGTDIENSVSTRGLPSNSEHVLDQLSRRPGFLMVGTLEPRKGYTQTLSAFEKLWMQGVDANLVIVGKQGWMVEKLVEKLRRHSELGRRLFWLEGISDEYLEKVYASCTCLIAASEGEGFGLPLIEAAQHKLPIIARDIPVFHEVAGEHAFYFKGKEPDDLAKAVQKWLELYHSGQHPKSDDMPWLTWNESASQLLDIIIAGKWQMEYDGSH
ncbi:MAG: glycosyltransferase family 4 protein [Methanothrix sp.]|nr:glycosyltransferase family 4 protein [Methanothrix sp.]